MTEAAGGSDTHDSISTRPKKRGAARPALSILPGGRKEVHHEFTVTIEMVNGRARVREEPPPK